MRDGVEGMIDMMCVVASWFFCTLFFSSRAGEN